VTTSLPPTPVTHDSGRGIRFYQWAYTNAHILYSQDTNGDENWRLYAVDVQTKRRQGPHPFAGVQAQLIEVSPKFPPRFWSASTTATRSGTMCTASTLSPVR